MTRLRIRSDKKKTSAGGVARHRPTFTEQKRLMKHHPTWGSEHSIIIGQQMLAHNVERFRPGLKVAVHTLKFRCISRSIFHLNI